MLPRTYRYDSSHDALFLPHLTHGFFPGKENLPDDLLCAECALLAYKRFESDPAEAKEAQDALASVGFTESEAFDRSGSQAFAAWNPLTQTAVVSFRGTEQDPTDLGTDLKAVLVAWDQGGRVHAGFKAYWEDLAAGTKMLQWIEDHKGRLLLTGHSLGAALSTLAASYWINRGRTAKLVTIGSPRVGDSTFVATLPASKIEVSRYVDCCDIVTLLPPPELGFLHVSDEAPLYIDRLGELHSGATQDFIRGDRVKAREEYIVAEAWRKHSVPLRDLADHAPINYVYALRHQVP